MKGALEIIVVCVLININAFTQNTISFKGQVYHNKLGPQKNLSILVDNQYPAVTNDAGVFVVALPKNTNHVKVSLTKTNFTILYPFGGYIPIPRDLNQVPQVVIGSAGENEYLRQYVSLYKLLKKKPANTTDPNILVLKKKMDSLETLLVKLHYSETELRTAKEIQDGKDDYLPEITADLSDYSRNAINLKAAFKYIAEYAFDNPNALQKLVEALNSYNNTFDKLDRQHVNYEKRVADFWQDEETSSSFKNLVDYALDSVHKNTILPMQETVAQLRSYFESRKKNNDLKKNIQSEIYNSVQQLDLVLARLDDKTEEVMDKLRG